MYKFKRTLQKKTRKHKYPIIMAGMNNNLKSLQEERLASVIFSRK